jgi:hypothetical protein
MLINIPEFKNRFGVETIADGVYLIRHFNLDTMLKDLGYEVNSFYFDDLNVTWDVYGVCDSPEQLLNKINDVKKSSRKYVIGMCRIDKKRQPDQGGWRWHKWGDYIGEQNPSTEYLKDEPTIETVYTFHIYKITHHKN